MNPLGRDQIRMARVSPIKVESTEFDSHTYRLEVERFSTYLIVSKRTEPVLPTIEISSSFGPA